MSEPLRVRDMVRQIKAEMITGELLPERARSLLMKATALLGNCLDEIRVADHDYSVVLLTYLDSDEAANRARIRAETTQEFRRKQEARDTKELLLESVRSLKHYLESLSDEMRLAR